jgi:hypothetical protein
MSQSPEQLAASYAAWEARRDFLSQESDDGDNDVSEKCIGPLPPIPEGVDLYEDIDQLYTMLVYLGQTNPREPWNPPATTGGYYDCIHLLPSGDCGNYKNRPRMCREYPYGQPCRFAICGWDDALLGHAPLALGRKLVRRGAVIVQHTWGDNSRRKTVRLRVLRAWDNLGGAHIEDSVAKGLAIDAAPRGKAPS